MCELCLPTVSRRRMLALSGAVVATTLLGRPDPGAAAPAVPTGYGVAIEPRSTWAGEARPMLETPPDEDVRFLLVHHTAGPSEGDPIELIRQVYDFHTGPEKGWPDVAYNFFVEPGGRVFEGRDGSLERAVSASATGGNQGFAQLVCLLGDFTNRNPTDAQLVSLNRTLAWLADRYALDTSPGATRTFTSRGSNLWAPGTEVVADVISGHREMSATACPGDTFYPYLKDRVRAEVHALREFGSVAPAPTTTPSPADTLPETVPTTVPDTVPVTTSGPSPTVATTASSTITARSTIVSVTTSPPTTASPPAAAAPSSSSPTPRVEAAEPAQSVPADSSSDPVVWGVGVAGVAVVATAVVYAGVRRSTDGRNDSALDGPDRPD